MRTEARTGRTDRGGVQVVERVAAILLALRGKHDGLSLSEIAERVGLPRSTVHRLVVALERERFVAAASANGGFRLGPAIASLANSTQRELTLVVHPFLAALGARVAETVDLAVLEHDHVLFVDQVPAEQRLRAVSAVGVVFPAHCSANGKALLAALPDAEIERLLPARLEALTPRTITSRADLLDELQQVRESGVAYDREEHTVGICAVGAAIAAPGSETGAITIPLPAQRFYGNEQQLVAALLETQSAINAALAGGR
jgi:DNA-binding IclR family transcriptional regulator